MNDDLSLSCFSGCAKRCYAVIVILTLACLLLSKSSRALDFTFSQQVPVTPLPLSSFNTRQADTALESTLFERSQWPLSDTEWQRYLKLIKGIRGSISPKSLSPVEVLGIHAETTQERKKYATLWAKMLHEDVQRTLAFQRAYAEAASTLYGATDLFAVNHAAALKTPSAPVTSAQRFLDGDRLLVFLKVNGCLQCTVVIQQLLSQTARQKIQVDVYFTDTHEGQDDTKIVAWAKNHRIDPQRVQQKVLTLNHDNGTYTQISHQLIAQVPSVYLLRNHQLSILKL